MDIHVLMEKYEMIIISLSIYKEGFEGDIPYTKYTQDVHPVITLDV